MHRPSSRTASKAPPPPPEESAQEKLAQERLQILDTETDKLIDLFSRLLDATKVSDRKTCGEREALQTSVNASQLVQSCERLLELVGDIKLDIILHDYQRYLHRHVKQQRMNYIREHESFLRSPEHRQWQSIMRGSATEPQGAEDTGQAMDVDM